MKLLCFLSLFFITAVQAENADWRTASTPDNKIKQLIKVMPTASIIMLQMGERYKNLYWAAKQKKWEFAEYQLEEMEELIDMLIISDLEREKTATEFKRTVFATMSDKLKTKEWKKFETGFGKLRSACISCHAKNGFPFITFPIPKSANSPVLGMQ